MKGILAICLAFSIVFSSCAPLEPKKEETARELAEKGMAQFDRGRYRESIQTFMKLRDWYPFSEYAVEAELMVGDALYHLLRYEDAIRVYSAFENLHSGHEKIPYAVNQIGLCYSERIGAIDRDQTSAENAMRTFQRLVKQYPDSIYASKAQEKIEECQKHLAAHELSIGIYYFKKKSYRAALHRFNAVIVNYPDVGGIHHQALQYISLCKQSLNAQSLEGK